MSSIGPVTSTTDSPWPTGNELMTALAAMKASPPLPKRGHPDIRMGRGAYEQLRTQCDERHTLTPRDLWAGVAVELSDILPSNAIEGVSEVGRKMVQSMNDKAVEAGMTDMGFEKVT